MATPPTVPPRRITRVTDVVVVVVVLLAIGLGIWLYGEIRELRSLTSTLATTGRGLEQAGSALEGLPSLIGGSEIEQLAADASQAGQEARASAGGARDTLNTVSVLVGVTVAVVPTLALLALYLPLRIGWHRARRTDRV